MTTNAHDPVPGELVISRARQEIVFIESNVPDIDALIRSVGAGKQIVILDAAGDGLAQIVEALAGRDGVDAIHIMSHGAAGTLNLGQLTLDAASLNANDAALQAIGASLAPDADILLYGCNVGAGAAGADFLDGLAIATGADVAASNDLTGAQAAGGDWELEITRGDVQARAAVDPALAAHYAGVLAITSPVQITFNQEYFYERGYDVNANKNVVYEIGGDPSYRLVIDGLQRGVVAYDAGGNSYVNIAGQEPVDAGETQVTISFQAGQTFSVDEVALSVMGTGAAQSLTLKGYQQDGDIFTKTVSAAANIFEVANLAEFDDIVRLVITTTENGGLLKFFALDNLMVSNVYLASADTTPPGPPVSPQLSTASDSGTKGDRITNDTIPTFFGAAGSAEAGARLDLYGNDRINIIGTTTVAGDGSWSATITTELGDGAHTFTAFATDAAGNISNVSQGTAITIDTTAPSTQVINVTFSDDTGVEGDFVTSISQQRIQGSLSAPLAAGERLEVSYDNGVNYSTVDAATGATLWTIDRAFSGSDTLRLRVIDVADNAGTVFSQDYTIDATAPGAPSTPDLVDGSDTGTSGTDNLTGDTTPTFSGTADADAVVTLYADGKAVGSTTASDAGNWSITASQLDGGTYSMTARASDLAGNQGIASGGLDVTIVTAAPGTTSTTLTLGQDSNIDGDRVTNVAGQSLGGKLSANLAAGEQVDVYVNGAWQTATSATGSDTWSLEVTLVEGLQTVQVRVVDGFGNAGPSGEYDVRLDTTAPTLAITSNTDSLKAGESATITFTFSEDPGMLFAWDGKSGDIDVSGGTLSALSGSGLTRSATFTPNADTEGSAGISVQAGAVIDLAGNGNLAASLSSLEIDTLAPAAPSTPQLEAASDTGASNSDRLINNDRPTFQGTAEAGSTVIVYADGKEIGSGIAVAGAWLVDSTVALGEGAHTITATTVDGAGNVSVASDGQVITIDTTAPTVAITSSTDRLKIGESATITFTFSEAPGTSLDAGLIAVGGGTLGALKGSGLSYSATFTPTDGVDGGKATISLSAGSYQDAAGNAGAVGITPTLSYDTLAPSAPSLPDLDAASDTGASNTDNITGDTTPTFSGTAESGATITLYSGSDSIGSAIATGGKWSITSTELGAGAHDISVTARDAAGNTGPASAPLSIQIVTDAPATRVASVALSADTGDRSDDLITRTQAQTISGTLDRALANGERVEVSVDGENWNTATSDTASTWSIAATLVSGTHAIMARVVNAIDNAGEVFSANYMLDQVAPTVAITSSTEYLKAGESATITFTFSEAPPTPPGAGSITVDGGKLSELKGSGLSYSATFTPTAGIDFGKATISLAAGSYQDLAGNAGAAGSTPTLGYDTLAPNAPAAPTLAAASDTGAIGDGVTTQTTQVIEGSGAGANATVRLYDGQNLLATAQANESGHWSITANLAVGSHSLSVTQDDAAGNTSNASAPFALTVSRPANPNPNPTPTPTPTPPTVVDGVPVTTTPVTLPGGVAGTSVSVPIVTSGRTETDGSASLADIPLLASGGQTVLLAQLPVGFGLSSNGGIAGTANAQELLIAAIRAATPSHAAGDQGHLVQNGVQFLAGLDASGLAVSTVRPVSAAGSNGTLILSGANPSGGQGTALVIETGSLAAGSALELRDIDFAAIVGAANVSAHGSGTILTGDAASQHFTVDAGSSSQVFAGGGNDVLTFAADTVAAGSADGRASALAVPATGVTTLHGGLAADTASFTGQRVDYDIAFHNGYAVVNSKAAPDAKALVVNVEALQFSDGVVAVENGAGLTTLAGMYQTVFGRQADLGGFEFWADHRDAGLSWGTLALELIGSSEHVLEGGGLNGDAAHDIGLLYQALFDRAADSAGLAFWQDAMARGVTLEQVAGSFVESAEMVGHQRAVLDWDFSL